MPAAAQSPIARGVLSASARNRASVHRPYLVQHPLPPKLQLECAVCHEPRHRPTQGRLGRDHQHGPVLRKQFCPARAGRQKVPGRPAVGFQFHERPGRDGGCETEVTEDHALEHLDRGGHLSRLPGLPFDDHAFALVLSSHLLFVYPDPFDAAAHLAAVIELARVASGEVRIFPLVDTTTALWPGLDALRRDLAAHGHASEVRSVPYEFIRGGVAMLVVDGSASSGG